MNPEPVVFTSLEFVSGGNTDNTSYAAFFQGTFSLTDRLDITGGIRYTRDEKDSLPLQPFTANYTPNPAFNPGNLVLASRHGIAGIFPNHTYAQFVLSRD